MIYQSNNSDGRWWLTDADWRALAAAGWDVTWIEDDPSFDGFRDSDGRFLGALAITASKDFPSCADGIAEWERITSKDANEDGCECCGSPHYFDTDGEVA